MREQFFMLVMYLILMVILPYAAVNAQDEALDMDGLELQEEMDENKPTVEVNLSLSIIRYQINDESRSNPDNKISDLNENQQVVESSISLEDYLDDDESFRALLKLHAYKSYESERDVEEDKDLVRIDELFLDWSTEDWFISLGKRRNSWGPALAFNPVNVVVPPRDPLSPDQQSEGHPILFGSYASDLIEMDVILTRNYDRDWYGQYARWGGRFAVILEESDIGLYYFDGEKDEDDNPYPRMYGFSYSGNFLDDSTLYLEVAAFSENTRNYYQTDGSVLNREEMVYKGVIGSNTTLDGNTSILCEIYHNSGGYTTEERKEYFKAVDSVVETVFDPTKASIFADQQFAEMNRNYALISFRKSDIFDQFGFVAQVLAAEDSSYQAELEGDYNISDYYKYSLLLRGYGGDKDSEFGNGEYLNQVEFTFSASY